MKYTCRNYGTTGPTAYRAAVTGGSVWADLIDEDGNFHRRAIVANCNGPQDARRYADRMNSADNGNEVAQ